MSTVSKEILDKLRQLSDLLIVIKDSGNNTPQILKELAVEKCSEIYSALSSKESVAEYKIVDTPKEEGIEEPSVDNTPSEIVFEAEVVNQETLFEATEESKPVVEEEIEEESVEIPIITIEEEESAEEEEVMAEEEVFNTEITPTEEESYTDNFEPQESYEEIIIEAESYNDTNNYDEEYNDVNDEYDDIVVEEEDEEEEEVDLFASKESYKKCNHKKIRSVLAIGDIFLYKRELFGNSDVDMTDMYDAIDEAETLEDAMEYINEYFGSDVETEELVIEFVERVKQCFE